MKEEENDELPQYALLDFIFYHIVKSDQDSNTWVNGMIFIEEHRGVRKSSPQENWDVKTQKMLWHQSLLVRLQRATIEVQKHWTCTKPDAITWEYSNQNIKEL